MQALVSMLIPIIIIIVVALIIIWATERFSPDPLITKIIKVVVFAVVLIALLMKLVPLLGLH
jgi:type IV secretory pathway TrbL component